MLYSILAVTSCDGGEKEFPLGNNVSYLSINYLRQQFPDQAVPCSIALLDTVLVVRGDVDLVLKAQVVGESVQDVYGEALVLLWLPQHVLRHHHERLLLKAQHCITLR